MIYVAPIDDNSAPSKRRVAAASSKEVIAASNSSLMSPHCRSSMLDSDESLDYSSDVGVNDKSGCTMLFGN